jgi:hypothetical protein
MADSLAINKRKVEDTDQVDEPPKNRPRSDTSEPQKPLIGVPSGIKFFSLMNKKKRFFLPSSKNYFHGFKVSRILCDSGCSSILLPIESPNQLRDIFAMDSKAYRIAISKSNNVSGNAPVLTVHIKSPDGVFHASLCDDILGSSGCLSTPRDDVLGSSGSLSTPRDDVLGSSGSLSTPRDDVLGSPRGCLITTTRLRFSLCREDTDTIRSTEEYRERVGDLSFKKLNSADCVVPEKRRTHALLGQDVLARFLLIKYLNMELYLDATKYSLPHDVDELKKQMDSLETQLEKELPEDFNDWEDDDHSCEDDEMVCDDD